jgi:hypothetical protein
MTFRDYAHGAFRMRGIGKGQTVELYLNIYIFDLPGLETD